MCSKQCNRAGKEGFMLRPGQTVYIHYAGTLENGVEFINTWIAGQPVPVTIGNESFLPAFMSAVQLLNKGERTQIHIPVSQAYGPWDPSAVIQVPREQIPRADYLKENSFIFLSTALGPAKVKVAQINGEHVSLDCNHELAGHSLNFEIELVWDGTESLIEREQMTGGCGCGCDKLQEALSADQCSCGHHH